jgi:hypothetical protein
MTNTLAYYVTVITTLYHTAETKCWVKCQSLCCVERENIGALEWQAL